MSMLKIAVEEGGATTYVCTLKDDADAPIQLAAIATLTATLYGKDRDEVINSRDNQSVKNANGGTVDATSGEFALDLLAADNIIQDAESSKETHILLMQMTLTNGKSRNWEVQVRVTNLHRVP